MGILSSGLSKGSLRRGREIHPLSIDDPQLINDNKQSTYKHLAKLKYVVEIQKNFVGGGGQITTNWFYPGFPESMFDKYEDRRLSRIDLLDNKSSCTLLFEIPKSAYRCNFYAHFHGESALDPKDRMEDRSWEVDLFLDPPHTLTPDKLVHFTNKFVFREDDVITPFIVPAKYIRCIVTPERFEVIDNNQ